MVVLSQITTSGRRRLFICARYCTKPCPLRLTLILCLVLRLCGGAGYPQYKAAELNNNNNETIETKYYPLYDKILNYWFPPTEGYDVSPQWSIPDTTKTVDFTITFVIEHHQQPLLLVEIKPPSDFKLDSGRDAAVIQVSMRLGQTISTQIDCMLFLRLRKSGGHVTPIREMAAMVVSL